MRYCVKCGNQVSDDAVHCNQCGLKIPVIETTPAPAPVYDNLNQRRETDYGHSKIPYGEGARQVFTRSEGEEIIRSYCACNKREGLSTVPGYLYVTNKRIIFYCKGTGANYSETKLDTVSGLNCSTGKRYLLGLIIAGVMSIAIGILLFGAIESVSSIGFYSDNSTSPSAVISLIMFGLLGVALIMLGIRDNFRLIIYSSAAAGAPINLGNASDGLLGVSIDSGDALPTAETMTMIKELGAMINDIQEKGDYAIEKWKVKY